MYEKLINLTLEIKSFDISNREGDAAKIYWHTVYGKEFNRKVENNTNLLLNYGYAVLNALISRSIVKKGLDTRISLFHKSFNNQFALSSDFIEIFRQLIDNKIYSLMQFSSEINIHEAKSEILDYLANIKLEVDNKNQYLTNAIDYFIDCIIQGNHFPNIKINYEQINF